jgi:hypothetical protein
MAQDAIYEIASTDAWRALLNRLEGFQRGFEQAVLQMAAKQDAKIEEIARASGRVDAVKAILAELRTVGKQNGS